MNNEGDYLNFANELKEQYDETQREHQRKIEEEKRKQQLLKEEIKEKEKKFINYKNILIAQMLIG